MQTRIYHGGGSGATGYSFGASKIESVDKRRITLLAEDFAADFTYAPTIIATRYGGTNFTHKVWRFFVGSKSIITTFIPLSTPIWTGIVSGTTAIDWGFHWTVPFATGAAANVRWKFGFEHIKVGESLANMPSAFEVNLVNVPVGTNPNLRITTKTNALVEVSGAPGDKEGGFIVYLEREGTHVDDTYPNDCDVLDVFIDFPIKY